MEELREKRLDGDGWRVSEVRRREGRTGSEELAGWNEKWGKESRGEVERSRGRDGKRGEGWCSKTKPATRFLLLLLLLLLHVLFSLITCLALSLISLFSTYLRTFLPVR